MRIKGMNITLLLLLLALVLVVLSIAIPRYPFLATGVLLVIVYLLISGRVT